jgi:hypothetical protein
MWVKMDGGCYGNDVSLPSTSKSDAKILNMMLRAKGHEIARDVKASRMQNKNVVKLVAMQR